jgi:hypothetical protein
VHSLALETDWSRSAVLRRRRGKTRSSAHPMVASGFEVTGATM